MSTIVFCPVDYMVYGLFFPICLNFFCDVEDVYVVLVWV